jgi:serine phosphatase RsbU (regulator of sigma subunit)
MNRINTRLVEDLPPDRFVTFVAGVLEPEKSRLQLLSAGHGPLFVYRASDDRVEDHSAHGIPFGVSSAFQYESAQEISLLPGDMVVLLTDGFFEWEDPDGEQYGIERLKKAMRSNNHLSPADLIAKLHSEVLAFVKGTEQKDDLTAVIVKRKRSV